MSDTITLPRAIAEQALHVATAAGYPVALIAALRAALEQPKPPPEAQTEAERLAYCAGWWAAMEQKREQPEQVPVAWGCFRNGELQTELIGTEADVNFWCASDEPEMQGMVKGALYTHPPRREWRSLTEGALMGLYIDFDRKVDTQWTNAEYLLRLMDTVQAKLKEKNHHD